MTQLPTFDEIAFDLKSVSARRRTISLLAPFCWSGGYFGFASFGWWLPAAICVVALSFVTYGSVSHDLVHGNLGLRRRLNSVLLTLIELICLRSGHAYRMSHLHHHARFPHVDDIEGASARMSLLQTLWDGVTLQPRLWIWSLRRAGGEFPIILLEGVACGVLIVASILTAAFTPIFIVYCTLVIAGSWVYPFMTVYLVHDAAGETELFQTKAYRGKVASWLAFEHLYHLEHHLYPAVPHYHWPKLARRLDPHLKRVGVRPRKILF